MHSKLFPFLLLFLVFQVINSFGQTETDTVRTEQPVRFSGTVGVTNNGFSIIPTFSLNSPATIINLSWAKNRFSFDPDIRLVPDASKGGFIFWFRYRLIEKQKLTLRVGAHPAFTMIRRFENGTNTEITEMLRFLAYEVVPTYQISPKWGVSAMFLQGHGLADYGPQRTEALFFSSAISQIQITPKIHLSLFPSIYFLQTDGYKGKYLAVTSILGHTKSGLSIQSTINQTISSSIPGNQFFMWNLGVHYSFQRTYKRM
ncbi:MAG: hypothetical protein ACK4R6_06215 [Spirosomataceae bacterium]